MKRFAAVAVIIGVTSAFAPRPNIASSRASSAFYATRREFAQQSAAVLGGALYFGNAAPAFAGGPRGADYVPKFDDLKVLYQLGMSLDRLVNKFSVEETVEAGLDGVREFNRQPNFYPGYAKNYISKSILNNADGDPRVGYIKQACKLISSTEDVLETGLADKTSRDEAVKRVKKAQGLIAKFLAESGVKDDAVTSYIASHPY